MQCDYMYICIIKLNHQFLYWFFLLLRISSTFKFDYQTLNIFFFPDFTIGGFNIKNHIIFSIEFLCIQYFATKSICILYTFSNGWFHELIELVVISFLVIIPWCDVDVGIFIWIVTNLFCCSYCCSMFFFCNVCCPSVYTNLVSLIFCKSSVNTEHSINQSFRHSAPTFHHP